MAATHAGQNVDVQQRPQCVTVAATQFACSGDVESNLRKAEQMVRDAAGRGAQIVLLQELFSSLYFPIEQRDNFQWAVALDEDRGWIHRFQALARELAVVLPISFYERAGNSHFNSVLLIDADGSAIGIYRKSHIPDGPGYNEKYFFTPGDTGFRTFATRYARIGVAVCWDQWFPEAARCMAIDGAELLLYPTAIGSEPHMPALDTCGHWQRAMQGHAAANLVPVIASNRIGKEIAKDADVAITFYGSSFMTDHTGLIVADAGRHQETTLLNTYNLAELRNARLQWGIFRDRRPELYRKLTTFDGHMSADRSGVTVDRRPQVYGNTPSAGAPSVGATSAAAPPPPPPPQQLVTVCPRVPPAIQPLAPPQVASKSETLLAGTELMGVDADRQRMMTTHDMHEASFIGDVKLSAQRRPRGRCWVCRSKTTYECKICAPGPVPLCNRTARDCWWKYHAGEVSPYVPNKRGRKRRKTPDADAQAQAQAQAQVQVHQQVHPHPQEGIAAVVPDQLVEGGVASANGMHHHQVDEAEAEAEAEDDDANTPPELNGDVDDDAVKEGDAGATQSVGVIVDATDQVLMTG